MAEKLAAVILADQNACLTHHPKRKRGYQPHITHYIFFFQTLVVCVCVCCFDANANRTSLLALISNR